MVKELGTFFEEFTKEYLHIVEECEIVETDYPFKITREDYKAVESKAMGIHWSDIDVIGIKGNVVHLISCSEIIGEKRVINKLQKNLIYAERAVSRKFPNKNIVKRVACISKRKDLVLTNIDIIYFRDMVNLLLRRIQRRAIKSKQSMGRVNYLCEWLIRALDYVGFLSEREEAYKIYKHPPRTHTVNASEFIIKPVQ